MRRMNVINCPTARAPRLGLSIDGSAGTDSVGTILVGSLMLGTAVPQHAVAGHCINGDPDVWRDRCDGVDVVDHFGVPQAIPFERDRPNFLCRHFHGGLRKAWPGSKTFVE